MYFLRKHPQVCLENKQREVFPLLALFFRHFHVLKGLMQNPILLTRQYSTFSVIVAVLQSTTSHETEAEFVNV
jgi:hypothetical protein